MELDSKFDFEAKLSEFSEGLKDLDLDDDVEGFKELDKLIAEMNAPIPDFDFDSDWTDFDKILAEMMA